MPLLHPDRRESLVRFWTWSLSLVAVALPILAWQVQGNTKSIAWAEAQEDLFVLGPRFQAALEQGRTELILGQSSLRPHLQSSLGEGNRLLDRPEIMVPQPMDQKVSSSVAGGWYFEGLRRLSEPLAALGALETATASLLEEEVSLALQIDLQKALLLARMSRYGEGMEILESWRNRIDPAWTLQNRPAGLILGFRIADLHHSLGEPEMEQQQLDRLRTDLVQGRWPMTQEGWQVELSFLSPPSDDVLVSEELQNRHRLMALPEFAPFPGLALAQGDLLLVEDQERLAAQFPVEELEQWLSKLLREQIPESSTFQIATFRASQADKSLPSLPLDLSSFLLPDLPIFLPDLDAYLVPLRQRQSLVLLAVTALSAVLLSLTWFGRRLLQREAALQRTRTEFLAGVSHELRTPAASLSLLSENLLEGRVVGEERTKEYYRAMRRDARRLERLVADVLDVSRMERGTFSMEREPCDLKVLLEALVEEQKPRLADAGIELECRIAVDLPVLHLDPFAVERACANLLENARRYAVAGGWTCISATQTASGGVEIRVADRGPGIPTAWRERIFSPYERLPQNQDLCAGAGLGLALVKAVLLAHGGDVRVEHGENRTGSVFVMEFAADGSN